MNDSEGKLTAGELVIEPESLSLSGFEGRISYNGSISIDGMSEKAEAVKSGIKYDIS